MSRVWLSIILFAVFVGHAYGGSLTILQTTQSGGQSQLDVNHSYFWSFSYSGSTAYSPIKATFSMKVGNSATANAVMALYSANSDGSNNVKLKEVSRGASSGFSSSGFQTEEFVLYTVAEPTVLPGRFNIVLTSDAEDKASKQFFIKGSLADSSFSFKDSGGQSITGFTYGGAGTGSGGGSTFSAVPEPSLLISVPVVLVCIFVLRRRPGGTVCSSVLR